MDLLAVISKPRQIGSQGTLRRIGVLGLAHPLSLDLAVVASVLLDLDSRRRERVAQEGCEVELAKVEVLAAS